MDVSRISRGKVQLKIETVTLQDVLHSALEAAQELIEQKHHELSLMLPDEPVTLDADPVRLTQVFSNLLTNAARYTNEGGNIIVETKVDTQSVEVSIIDNGNGIPEHLLNRIFEIFVQAKRPLDRSLGGLGIGLTLAKSLVILHGGTIRAESEGPGHGSRFTVTLPVSSRRIENQQEADSSTVPPSQRNLRILVVDDNESAARLLSMVLQSNGHEVQTMHSGNDALRAGAEFQPHVVLLDLGMPGMNGLETARSIRQATWGEATTLIAVTGWGHENDRRETDEAGFDYHLVKPVEATELLSLLSRLPVARSS